MAGTVVNQIHPDLKSEKSERSDKEERRRELNFPDRQVPVLCTQRERRRAGNTARLALILKYGKTIVGTPQNPDQTVGYVWHIF